MQDEDGGVVRGGGGGYGGLTFREAPPLLIPGFIRRDFKNGLIIILEYLTNVHLHIVNSECPIRGH